MKAFADGKEKTYDLLRKSMKKKSPAHKSKRNSKNRQKRRFRRIEKRKILTEIL